MKLSFMVVILCSSNSSREVLKPKVCIVFDAVRVEGSLHSALRFGASVTP
jgi:hypothetical protein